jgi:hypothetical protein
MVIISALPLPGALYVSLDGNVFYRLNVSRSASRRPY